VRRTVLPLAALIVGLVRRPVLPLATLILVVALKLAAVVATNDFGVLRVWLIAAATALALFIAPMIRPTLPAIGAAVLWFIGKRLCSDTYTQQTNTGQTPDARFHAFPHGGLGPVRKTGKAQAGSATGYQSRNFFIERLFIKGMPNCGQEKRETRRPPFENFVRARRL
jgi:hypothetical protein